MVEPLLKVVDNLSIWDLSHYWHGANPQKTSASRLPLEVQKTIRALALKASRGLYLRCAPEGFVYNRLTDPDDLLTIKTVKRLYQREFNYAIQGRKYKRNFLCNISMGRKGILIWCKQNQINPPSFWFSKDDPLCNKTIEELKSPLSPQQMKNYGYVALFDLDDAIQNGNLGFQFSSDVESQSDRPDFKHKNSIIKEALSEINRKNAKARYAPLNKHKDAFRNFVQDNDYKSKSKAARDYFAKLNPEDRKIVVPTYYENDHDNGVVKAVRTLTNALRN